MEKEFRALSERYTRVAELERELAREKEALVCQLGLLQQGLISGAPLTSRQKEVYSLCVAGKTNKEIGNSLSISERTVKYHISTIFVKMGVQSRMDLILATRASA